MNFQCIDVLCGVCVDICPSKSLLQKPHYRKPVAERLTISLQGKPRKKSKDKEKAKEKEAPAPEPGAEVSRQQPLPNRKSDTVFNIFGRVELIAP